MDRPGVQFERAATLALLFVCVVHAMAWAGERPAIASARVYVEHSRIVTDLDCARLFSEQIIGTVESGLPAVVELLYKLTDDEDKDVRRGVHTYRLHYDVWDDVYALERGGASETFSSFIELRSAVERMRAVPIVPVDDIEPGGVYAIELSIAVHPLRGGEQKRIVGWVDENVRGTSDGSWHEQLLNVNGLIHRFFSRDRDDSNRSEWFRTIMFTPASLPLARADEGDSR
jgi:hypothetical protein